MVPGAVGAVSLLVGLYALNMLDVNVAGALLIVLGMAFMAAEALTPTFGVFAGAGVLAFLAGSLFLFRGDMPEFSLSPWVIGGATLVTAGVFLWAAAEGLREWRRPVRSGEGEYVDAPAVVLDWSAGAGFVRFHGETWRARGPEKLEAGAQARVVGRNGLMLEVVADGDVAPAKGAPHDI
jgi:membrane-bound serine protease (ClpP class)